MTINWLTAVKWYLMLTKTLAILSTLMWKLWWQRQNDDHNFFKIQFINRFFLLQQAYLYCSNEPIYLLGKNTAARLWLSIFSCMYRAFYWNQTFSLCLLSCSKCSTVSIIQNNFCLTRLALVSQLTSNVYNVTGNCLFDPFLLKCIPFSTYLVK